MQKKRLKFIWLWFFLWCFFYVSQANATGPRVAPNLFTSDKSQLYALEYPPFITSQSITPGSLYEVINAVIKQQELNAEINILPSINMAKYYFTQEHALGLIGYDFNLTAQQKENTVFVPVLSVSHYFYFYQPAFEQGLSWNGKLSDLVNKRLGIIKGKSLKKYKQVGMDVKSYRLQALLGKLRARDIDLIVLPEATLNRLVEAYFPNEKNWFIRLQPKDGEVMLGVFFNTQHAEGKKYAAKFKAGLEKLKVTGEFNVIVQKYADGKQNR